MIKKKDLTFIIIAVLVVALLTYLSTTGKERFITRIPAHMTAIYINDRAQADAYCFSCHDPKAPAEVRKDAPPMPPKHPLRTKNCRLCHRLERRK
jgi:hypothetical protein